MQFKKSLSIILATTQALLINAEKVTFKVIAVTGEPSVTVDGTPYAMQIDEYPVYKIEVDVSQLPVEYSYSLTENGSVYQEQFTRTRQTKKALNDFFNRSQTVVEHPQLPRAYPAFPTFVQSKLYDDNHVGTIIIECDPMQLQTLHSSTEASSEDKVFIPAKVIYANPYTIRTFKQAQLGLSGQSTRHVPKLSYKIRNLENEENKELFNRSSIKLRAEHMDPIFLRDKMYGDVLNSLGVPAVQNKFVRVFINNEPYGLFNLSDDITNGRYLRETFNKGEKTNEMIPIFKADYCPSCGGYGDLGLHTEDVNNKFYQFYTYKGDDTTKDSHTHFVDELFPLIKEIQSYSQGGEMSLDIDTFLKFMAMEYLGGGVDNYWNRPGNFYILKGYNTNTWYFHDADFHYTFGSGGQGPEILGSTLANYPPPTPEAPVDPLAEPNPTAVTVDKARPPLDAILSRPENQAKFNEIFDRLLKTAFHPQVFFARLQSLADLIREDAQWDFSLPKVNTIADEGESYIFDATEFENNLNNVETLDKSGGYSLTYFVNQRIASITQELGIQVPAEPATDLGYVENPSQAKEDKNKSKDASGAKEVMSWSIFSTLLVVFITMIMF